MVRKKSCLLLCLTAMFILSACSVSGAGSSYEEYTLGTELAITMKSGFSASEMPGADIYLSKGSEFALLAIRDTAESLAGYGYDPEQLDQYSYFDLVSKANGFTPVSGEADSPPFAVYRRSSGDTEYWYYVTVRECAEAFWTIYLICPAGDETECPQTIYNYASSIRIL